MNEEKERIEKALESQNEALEPPANVTDAVFEKDQTEETAPEKRPPENENLPVTELKKLPYHKRYYLGYHDAKRCTKLDLDGTRAFLAELGFDGGELRKARDGKDFAESFNSAESGDSMHCSYCGAEVFGVDFYRLPDGRIRCTNCSNTLVKTKAEAEKQYRRVIENLDAFFGVTIDVPVSIEFVDERKLKKKIGVRLGAPDEKSVLILGVAIKKKKEYRVLIENGAPRISLIATLAHELTHIWQYTHWDEEKHLKKCPKNKRLLIYEGMAKWVEIQYLYLIGETNVAKREELITGKREDEYGVGFCMYEERYPLTRQVMTCDESPFTVGQYPIE